MAARRPRRAACGSAHKSCVGADFSRKWRDLGSPLADCTKFNEIQTLGFLALQFYTPIKHKSVRGVLRSAAPRSNLRIAAPFSSCSCRIQLKMTTSAISCDVYYMLNNFPLGSTQNCLKNRPRQCKSQAEGPENQLCGECCGCKTAQMAL